MVPPRALPFGASTMPLRAGPFRLEAPDPPRPAGGGRLGATDPEGALHRPVSAPPLEEVVRSARRVLVVVSDGTRATAADRFLPSVIDRIGAGREIRFAVASGLHRRPTPEEIRRILGEEIAARGEIILHDPDAAAALVDVGRTRAGTRVRVHRELCAQDAVVLTGSVGFHYYAGFTGGRKAVVPGLAARSTIASNHLRALRRDGSRHPAARAGRLAGNPVHRDMVDGAALLGPAFLVNTVLAEDGGIERVFAGHWRRAHEAACRFVRRTRSVRLERRDLVVVSAGGRPHDLNLIQAHKAFEATFPAVRAGGVVVLVAACPDGGGHPDFLPSFELRTVEDHVRALLDDFRVYRQTALSWRRKLESCRLVLVSSLEPAVVRRLGAEPASDLDEALQRAAAYVEVGARGWVFSHGVRWLVESTR